MTVKLQYASDGQQPESARKTMLWVPTLSRVGVQVIVVQTGFPLVGSVGVAIAPGISSRPPSRSTAQPQVGSDAQP
jgi:hypothetical protein